MPVSRREVVVPNLRSLAWAGDDLIDWIGGQRIKLDGTVQPFGTGYSYRFDAATGLGEVGVAYEAFGTKARVMTWNGELPEAGFIPIGFDEHRELDRSYYQATEYPYPVCVLTLPDGRTAVAHCPRRYDTLELELVDGKGLTKRKKKPADIFHARLSASPDGKWLLSNGWVWHPLNVLAVYDVARALAEPAHLASAGLELVLGPAFDGEVDAATFHGDRLVASGSGESPALAVVELPSGGTITSIALSEHLGSRIMAWGTGQILALDGHPRVVSLADGTIVERLDNLDAGRGWHQPGRSDPPGTPYVAIDPARPRIAISRDDKIIVVTRED